jgi:protein O-GlcNAc transferase
VARRRRTPVTGPAKAARTRPEVEGWYLEAEARYRRGDPAGAGDLCARVLARAPGHVGALCLSGLIHGAGGDLATAAERLARAWALAPGRPEIAYHLGLAQFEQHRYEEAGKSFAAALALAPGRAEALRALGHVHWNLGRYAEARARFAQALESEPADMSNVHNLLFCACYDPGLTGPALAELHREWGRRYLEGLPDPGAVRHANPPNPERVLKVGYLSPDFRRHPVTVFLRPILATHDRSRVETYAYANVARPDDATAEMRAACAHWRDVTRLDDAALAERIRADGIDVLVELAGYSGGTRLRVLGRRPAPVQVSYLGYPATTGLPVVDWRLTDAVADPPGTEVLYTERVARIEGGFCCYKPLPEMPEPGPPPALARGHVTFASLVHNTKVNPAGIALWARVLHAVPEARMLVFRHTLAAESTRARYLEEFARHGIGPDRVRIGWEQPPHAEGRSFAVYRDVDIVLDVVPFTGHTSTCEALWMGVPVVTLAGTEFRGRLSAAVLDMAGRGEWVADTADGYVAVAARLAGDVAGLARLRRELRGRLAASRLMDAAAHTRALEDAYRAMWRAWCAGRTLET